MDTVFVGLKRLSTRLHILLFTLLLIQVVLNEINPEWTKENLELFYVVGEPQHIIISSVIILLSYLLFNYILGSFVIHRIKVESKESIQLRNIQNKLNEIEVELKVQGKDIKEIHTMKFDKEES